MVRAFEYEEESGISVIGTYPSLLDEAFDLWLKEVSGKAAAQDV